MISVRATLLTAAAVFAIALLQSGPAHACGANPPAGPTLLPKSFCEVDPPKWRLTASGSLLSTSLLLGEEKPSPLGMKGGSLRLGRTWSEAWFVSFGLASMAGALELASRGIEIRPGFAVDAAATHVWSDGADGGPFFTSTFGLVVARAFTGGDSAYTAIDLRANIVAGLPLLGRAAVYAGAAVFGGPTFVSAPGVDLWGGDRTHFRLFVGGVVALTRSLDLYVDVTPAPIGEQAYAGGVGVSF